jgi:hypothetical protein
MIMTSQFLYFFLWPSLIYNCPHSNFLYCPFYLFDSLQYHLRQESQQLNKKKEIQETTLTNSHDKDICNNKKTLLTRDYQGVQLW